MYKEFESNGEEIAGKEKDEFVLSLSRIPSRNSSMNCSSRFYYRSTEGIPFQWEKQPGMPKTAPFKEAIPPLSPPPALISLGLPKMLMKKPKPEARERLMELWRKYLKPKKNQEIKKVKYCLDKLDHGFGFNNSDRDFMESPCKSTSSSSFSSSMSFCNDPPSPPVAGAEPGSSSDSSDYRRLGCSRWNINTFIAAIGKRV